MDRFERKVKKLMKIFEKMFNQRNLPRGKRSGSDFEATKLGPEIDIKIVIINGDRKRVFTLNGSESPDGKAKEVEDEREENDPQELALKRFEEKKEEAKG